MITSALLLAGWAGGGWGWPLGWLFGVGWLLFWALVILACGSLIFRAGRWGWRGPAWYGRPGWQDPAARPEDSGAVRDDLEPARKILRERYARGEISTEEYRERLDNLG